MLRSAKGLGTPTCVESEVTRYEDSQCGSTLLFAKYFEQTLLSDYVQLVTTLLYSYYSDSELWD